VDDTDAGHNRDALGALRQASLRIASSENDDPT
jgi:hypothetical protein